MLKLRNNFCIRIPTVIQYVKLSHRYYIVALHENFKYDIDKRDMPRLSVNIRAGSSLFFWARVQHEPVFSGPSLLILTLSLFEPKKFPFEPAISTSFYVKTILSNLAELFVISTKDMQAGKYLI